MALCQCQGVVRVRTDTTTRNDPTPGFREALLLCRNYAVQEQMYEEHRTHIEITMYIQML